MTGQSIVLRAIRYVNLDTARKILEAHGGLSEALADGSDEPQGLLAVIPEDRVDEDTFVRLFGVGEGTVVDVERVPFSGFGPPADEADFMGFASQQVAYTLLGSTIPIWIEGCPQGAVDIHHLEALLLDGKHVIHAGRLAEKLHMQDGWDFDDLFEAIAAGTFTAQDVDDILHEATGADSPGASDV